MSDRTRTVVTCGLLVAASVVLARLFSFMIPIGGVGAIRLGFGPLPVIMAGIAFGPAAGGAVGMLADVVGYAVNPMGGAYIPYLTVSAALAGIVPGVVARVLGRERASFRGILIAVTAGQLVTSLLLTPYILYRVLGVPFLVNVPLRAAAQGMLIPTYSAVIYAVQGRLGVRAGAPVSPRVP